MGTHGRPEETGLYYCNARYYNPILGQWISPDSLVYLDYEISNGVNLYCYCYNNPTSYIDSSGNYPIYMASKGHQGNMRDTGLRDLTDEDIKRRLKELEHKKKTKDDNAERQRLVKEQKARRDRNKKKRDEYNRSKFELNYNLNYNIEIIHMPKKSESSMELIPTPSNNSFSFDWELAGKVAGGAMIVVGVVGAIIIIADDATLVGIADDVPGLAALWALICEGWHMIFG